jgi:hypothetical protein
VIILVADQCPAAHKPIFLAFTPNLKTSAAGMKGFNGPSAFAKPKIIVLGVRVKFNSCFQIATNGFDSWRIHRILW